MRIQVMIIILLSIAGQAMSQSSVPFDRKAVPDKDLLKKAMNAIGEGDLYYADDFTANFDSALYYYKIAQEINPNNAELNLKIGRCYLDLPSGKETMKCMDYFKKSLELDPETDPMIYFYMGKAYHINSDWKKAISHYNEFQGKLDPKKNVYERQKVARHIQECRNGIILSENPVQAKFENMGDWINTPYREHSPIISSNASVMYFTARLPNSTGGFKTDNGMYFEDVYVMHKREGGWSKPRNTGKPLNSNEHDATVSLSADGRTIIIMREGDLYYSTLSGGDWTTPKAFPKTINGKNTEETAASYADDGNTLYFISDRQPSIGGKDIFISKKDELGNWSAPENLGPTINTKYDENGVFMHPDGSTFYFISEGHNTIGGTDIFKSVKTEEGWSTPINLGIPINTPKDEQCIVVSANYRDGYYSTKGKDTHGDHDLYKVTFLEINEPMIMADDNEVTSNLDTKVKSVEVEGDLDYALLAGVVTDFSDDQPLKAKVEIKNTRNNKVVKEIETDDSGKFLTALPLGESYEIVVRSKGYLFYSNKYSELGDKGHDLEFITAKIKKIIPNQTVVLKNVFFKRASAEMLPDSYSELNRLVQILRENPGITIEISGHTDAIGNPANLMKLSRQRMESVRAYLINRGISKKRLKGRGYGGTRPIADNSDEDARAKNRRVEFKILSVE